MTSNGDVDKETTKKDRSTDEDEVVATELEVEHEEEEIVFFADQEEDTDNNDNHNQTDRPTMLASNPNNLSTSILNDYDDENSIGVQSDISNSVYDNDAIFDDMSERNRSLKDDERQKIMSITEGRAISSLRVFVIIVLILSAISASVSVYYYGVTNEMNDIRSKYYINSNIIIHSYDEYIKKHIQMANSYSIGITSYASTINATFPNVTIPNYVLLKNSFAYDNDDDGFTFDWLPLVTEDTRKGWEHYSSIHQNWIDDALLEQEKITKQQKLEHDNNNHYHNDYLKQHQGQRFNEQIFNTIIQGTEPQDEKESKKISQIVEPYASGGGPYLPLWQMSPVIPIKDKLNYNMLSHPTYHEALSASLSSSKVVMSELVVNTKEKEEEIMTVTNLFYPVFTNFDDSDNDNNNNRNLAGILQIHLVWNSFFQNFLDSHKNMLTLSSSTSNPNREGGGGYMCVLENTLNQTFTFQINTGTVNNIQFIGFGDHHDKKYDHMKISSSSSLPSSTKRTEEEFNTLDDDYCSYRINIYPSKELIFHTNIERTPRIYAIIVGSIFVFTTIVFAVYDCVVQRRQAIILNKAVTSGAIISSLFPETVRDRLLEVGNESGNDGGDSQSGRFNSFRIAKLAQLKHDSGDLSARSSSNHNVNNDSLLGKRNHSTGSLNRGVAMVSKVSNGFMNGFDNMNGAGRSNSYNEPSNNSHHKTTHLLNAPTDNHQSSSSMAPGHSSTNGYHQQKQQQQQQQQQQQPPQKEKRRFSNEVDYDMDLVQYKTAAAINKPIAEYFESTTIMFGDLAGFTHWSAGRQPEQVFELLETLFSTFDKIAYRRKVFKVETVGDCYVAVTGLPEPQEDHVVIMCKFARDCIISMKEIIQHKKLTLGVETADLDMRIGLHSGPVTAGVLRGQKSRFQLFGDTMNTASRMETNGRKGKIHISQETADLLIGAGKVHWIKPREDKIHAKGKGELQTFWVDFCPENCIMRRRSSS